MAVSAIEGSVVWDLTVPDRLSQNHATLEVSGSRRILVISEDSELYSINPVEPVEVIWNVTLSIPRPSCLFPVIGDTIEESTIAVGGSNGELLGLEALTGNVIWNLTGNSTIVFLGQVSGELTEFELIAGTHDGSVISVNPGDGSIGWKSQLPGMTVFFTQFSDSEFLTIPFSNHVVVLDGITGRLTTLSSLSFGENDQVHSPPACILCDDGDLCEMAFVTQTAVHLYDVRDKRLKWTYESAQGAVSWNDVFIVDVDLNDEPDVLAGAFDASIHGLRFRSGEALFINTDFLASAGPTWIVVDDLNSDQMSETALAVPGRLGLLVSQDTSACERQMEGYLPTMQLLIGTSIAIALGVALLLVIRHQRKGQTSRRGKK